MPERRAFSGRRTQAERTAATRARLLVATVDCVARYGYRGATTTRIASRAGVSRGAQLHHFPTRAALISAGAEHLFASLTSDYRDAFESRSGRRTIRAAIETLWSVMEGKRFVAVIEFYIAGRTDAALKASLAPVVENHRAGVARIVARHFPDLAADPARFSATLSLVLSAMLGMISERYVAAPDPATERMQLDAIEAMLSGLNRGTR